MSTTAHPAPKPAPLGFVLAVTFVLSIGTGSLTHGLHFIAKAAGFNQISLYVLGFIFGICYIASALFTGRVVRFLENNRKTALAPRTLLIAITLAAGLISGTPPILKFLNEPAEWAIWLVAASYGLITGLLWPMVEWYLSGGRRGKALRSAAGRFNITWTAAVVVAFFMLAPVLKDHSIEALWGVLALYIIAALLMLPFPKRPPKHIADHLETEAIDADASRKLLATARTLLPVSYMLGGVLGPYLPVALTRMGIDLSWQPIVAAIWLTARIPTMLVFERWHGWHGKAWPLALGAITLALGFIGCVLSPLIPNQSVAIVSLSISLALFGAAMGTIYTAAIYYAMEVGQGEIDSGAIHETLIGVGYALGPALGIFASLAVRLGVVSDRFFSAVLIGATVLACIGLATLINALTKPHRAS
ncbi:MAG: hypothetical protein H6808_07290 [Phycisphaera sp.]|nr:hypothetical protein [Phycisphaera sp.]